MIFYILWKQKKKLLLNWHGSNYSRLGTELLLNPSLPMELGDSEVI